MSKLIIGTRVYNYAGCGAFNFSRLEQWILCNENLAHSLVIATDEKLSTVIENLDCVKMQTGKVTILRSDPLTNFVEPLNKILNHALKVRADLLMYQSLEVTVSPRQVDTLIQRFDEKTLVVGGKMTPDHGGEVGTKTLSGWDAPWNTLAIWNPRKLGLTGFLTISGGLIADIPAGVEEVPVISALQELSGSDFDAKLVDVGPVAWDVEFSCDSRQSYHLKKLQSKTSRAAAQLQALGLKPGKLTVL